MLRKIEESFSTSFASPHTHHYPVAPDNTLVFTLRALALGDAKKWRSRRKEGEIRTTLPREQRHPQPNRTVGRRGCGGGEEGRGRREDKRQPFFPNVEYKKEKIMKPK